MNTTPKVDMHAPLPFQANADGVLMIGAASALDLAKTHGTPLFVYDRAIIYQTIAALRSALPRAVKLHYAVKANPFGPLLDHVMAHVDGLDVASQGELERVHTRNDCNLPISFAGPGKRDEELSRAFDLGCTVHVESEGELARLSGIAAEKAIRGKAAIRINPPFELRGSGMRMSGGAKPFGIDHDRVPAILKTWPVRQLDFEGFQIFPGSQCLSAEALCEAYDKALDLALDLAPHAPNWPKMVNIGGGLGVPYFPGDQAVDIAQVGNGLTAALRRRQDTLNGAQVILELGRYLVAEAGVYLTRVIDKKVSRGTVFLITDGGLHHQLAVSGNFGQVIRKNYPVALANAFGSSVRDGLETVNVVGCLCTPLDRLADQVVLPRAEVGDLIAIFRNGAYGPSASPTQFLSHPSAAEVLI